MLKEQEDEEALKESKMANTVELLREDHRKVKELFKEFEEVRK